MSVIKIKIPKGLPLAVAGNKPLRKAMASLLVLKAYYEAQGHVNREEITTAAEYCRVSTKTLKRRFAVLVANEIIQEVPGEHWHLSNWPAIREKFELKETTFSYVKDTGRDIVDVMEQIAMREPIDAQYKAYYTRIKYTPGLKEELTQVAGSYKASAVLQLQVQCFLTEGRDFEGVYLDENERYILNVMRADFTVNTNYYNDMFGYHGIGSMAYKKRKLREAGLITYVHRVYEMQGHTTRKSRETMLGDVLPPQRGGQCPKALLVMPDAISFLSPSSPFLPQGATPNPCANA